MSLIELMIAMVVLVVGMLALMLLVITSITSNNRSKLDTTGTMLAQTVLDGIAAAGIGGTPFTVQDCNSTALTIATAGNATGLGAMVDATTGNINWGGQAFSGVTPGYAIQYVSCGTSTGERSAYEVRWNVRTLTNFTRLVTVSARQIAMSDNVARPRFFAPPITLRTIAGQ
jgi:type II secretory pathway pseudopilin PulG